MSPTNTPNQPPVMQPAPAQPYVPPQAMPAAAPAVVYAQVPVPQPIMAPAVPHNVLKPEEIQHVQEGPPVLHLVGHSGLFYWWPVWAVGYIMALVTYMGGQRYEIGGNPERSLGGWLAVQGNEQANAARRWLSPPGRSRMDQQNGQGRPREDGFGNAAVEPAPQSGPPMGRHDDQAGVA